MLRRDKPDCRELCHTDFGHIALPGARGARVALLWRRHGACGRTRRGAPQAPAAWLITRARIAWLKILSSESSCDTSGDAVYHEHRQAGLRARANEHRRRMSRSADPPFELDAGSVRLTAAAKMPRGGVAMLGLAGEARARRSSACA